MKNMSSNMSTISTAFLKEKGRNLPLNLPGNWAWKPEKLHDPSGCMFSKSPFKELAYWPNEGIYSSLGTNDARYL